jgi:hypothetical protein
MYLKQLLRESVNWIQATQVSAEWQAILDIITTILTFLYYIEKNTHRDFDLVGHYQLLSMKSLI